MTVPNVVEPGYGIVDQPIAPHQPGRIRFQGTYWKAELAYSDCGKLGSGEHVQVVGRRGITLLVVPENYPLPVQCHQQTGDRQGSGRLFLL
jgi:membrane-bound ClpP family serine protease